MLKKKNIAMVMAAATVATSVAPVFAASLDGDTVSTKDSAKLDQLKEEIKGYLDLKYTSDEDLLKDDDLAGKSVYTVKISVNKGNEEEIISIRELDKALARLNSTSDTIKITVLEEKGHKIVNNQVVDNEVKKYKKSDITTLSNIADLKNLINSGIQTFEKKEVEPGTDGEVKPGTDGEVKPGTDGEVKPGTGEEVKLADKAANESNLTSKVEKVDVGTDNFGKDYIEIKFKDNDKKVFLKEGEDKTIVADDKGAIKEFTPIYKEDNNGTRLDKDGKTTIDSAKYVVEGFETFKEDIKDDDKEENKIFTIENKEVESNVQAKTLIDMNLEKLTTEGNEVARFIRDYNNEYNTSEKVKFNKDNDTTLTIDVPKHKEGITSKFDKLVLKGTKSEITALNVALNPESSKADVENVIKINTLAGENREATAIEVSKKAFATDKSAKNIVLVSGTSMADGLTATPLAAQKTAPILLTNSDKISAQVMKEIKRAMVDGGTVYLVGGTNSLKTTIEDQLDSQYIKYDRISGSDRVNTSLAVAKEMDVKKDAPAFVTGGHAEADSMSIAAVAAEKQSPILLTGENGLTKEQIKFISNTDEFKDAYVVGGTSKVSTDVEKSLDNLVKGDIDRLSGENRQGTNAKVIKEFYKEVKQVYVAKGNDNGLVDALATGVLASKVEGPVVLVGNTLNADQKSVLTKVGFKEDTTKKTQVGYGIADSIWRAINDINK